MARYKREDGSSTRMPTPSATSPAHRAACSAGTARTWADPEVRARRLAGIAAAQSRPDYRQAHADAMRARNVRVPAWVPADLAEEYRDIAAGDGEEAAARHVRRLKAEMRAPTRAFGYAS